LSTTSRGLDLRSSLLVDPDLNGSPDHFGTKDLSIWLYPVLIGRNADIDLVTVPQIS
jgi:hypothetical protein